MYSPSESTRRRRVSGDQTPLLSSDDSLSSGSSQTNEIRNFDDLLELVGSQGRYQKIILYTCVVPLNLVLAAVSYLNVFTLFIPEHFCSPEFSMNRTELMEWKARYIPRESQNGTGTWSSCTMYNYTDDLSRTEVPCQFGFIFNTKDFDGTVPTENGWVCDRDYYATTVFTTAAMGFLIGNIVLGQLTDIYGRKPVLLISLFLYIPFTSSSFFLTHFYQAYLVCTFIAGAGYPMFYTLPVLIMAELSGKEYRSWTYTVNWLAWVLGMAVLPGVAFLIRNWFMLSLVMTLPGFSLFLILPSIPESPRWLLSQGRVQESARIFQEIARVNGKSGAIDTFELVSILDQLAMKERVGNQYKLGFWSLFGTGRIAKITCCLAVARSASAMITDQLTLNSPYMSGNQFVNFFIMAFVQLPGTVVAGYLIETMGRRWTPVVFGLLSAGVCFAAGILPQELHMERIVLSAVAYFAETCVIYVSYVQAVELFPTSLRATGSAFCTTAVSLTGLLDASVVYTRKYYYGTPFLVMFLLSVIGSVTTAFLPETIGRDLPETLEVAAEFGSQDNFWSFLPHQAGSRSVSSNENQC